MLMKAQPTSQPCCFNLLSESLMGQNGITGCSGCGEMGRFPNAMFPMRTACLRNSPTNVFGTFSFVSALVATLGHFLKDQEYSMTLAALVGNLCLWVRNTTQETDKVVTSQVLTHSTQICVLTQILFYHF